MKICDTIQFTIWVGGDIDTAERWLREFCYRLGFCVTVDPDCVHLHGRRRVRDSRRDRELPQVPDGRSGTERHSE